MKENIQKKINRAKELAQVSLQHDSEHLRKTVRPDDSLSQAIRNEREADVFLAELNAAIAVSQKK